MTINNKPKAVVPLGLVEKTHNAKANKNQIAVIEGRNVKICHKDRSALDCLDKASWIDIRNTVITISITLNAALSGRACIVTINFIMLGVW